MSNASTESFLRRLADEHDEGLHDEPETVNLSQLPGNCKNRDARLTRDWNSRDPQAKVWTWECVHGHHHRTAAARDRCEDGAFQVGSRR